MKLTPGARPLPSRQKDTCVHPRKRSHPTPRARQPASRQKGTCVGRARACSTHRPHANRHQSPETSTLTHVRVQNCHQSPETSHRAARLSSSCASVAGPSPPRLGEDPEPGSRGYARDDELSKRSMVANTSVLLPRRQRHGSRWGDLVPARGRAGRFPAGSRHRDRFRSMGGHRRMIVA